MAKTPFQHRNKPSDGSHRFKRLAKRVHVLPVELECLFLKLEFQIKAGRFYEANGTFEAFIQAKAAGRSEFDDYETAGQLPLGLADIGMRPLNHLDDQEIYTVADLRAMTDAQLLEIPGMGVAEIADARQAAAELEAEFKRWWATSSPRDRTTRKGATDET